MEKYKYCPHCSQPLEDDGSCPGCAYGHKRQQAKPPSQQPRLCAFNDHGEPCHQPGHLSQTTHGGGPWYCRNHFAQINGWPAWQAAAIDDSQEAVDERVNKLVPRLTGESEHAWSMRCRAYVLDFVRTQTTKKPDKRWARKILDREATGEDVPLQALDYARAVAADQPEPGANG